MQADFGSGCGTSCVLTVARIKRPHVNHDEASTRALADRANLALKVVLGRHDWTT